MCSIGQNGLLIFSLIVSYMYLMNSDYFHSKFLSLPHFCRDPSYLHSLSHILSFSDSWRLARTVSVTIGLEIYSGAWWVHKYPQLRLTVSPNSEPSSSEQKSRTPRTCSSPLINCDTSILVPAQLRKQQML